MKTGRIVLLLGTIIILTSCQTVWFGSLPGSFSLIWLNKEELQVEDFVIRDFTEDLIVRHGSIQLSYPCFLDVSSKTLEKITKDYGNKNPGILPRKRFEYKDGKVLDKITHNQGMILRVSIETKIDKDIEDMFHYEVPEMKGIKPDAFAIVQQFVGRNGMVMYSYYLKREKTGWFLLKK